MRECAYMCVCACGILYYIILIVVESDIKTDVLNEVSCSAYMLLHICLSFSVAGGGGGVLQKKLSFGGKKFH